MKNPLFRTRAVLVCHKCVSQVNVLDGMTLLKESSTCWATIPTVFKKPKCWVSRQVADSVALLETKFWFLSLQLAANASFVKASEQSKFRPRK